MSDIRKYCRRVEVMQLEAEGMYDSSTTAAAIVLWRAFAREAAPVLAKMLFAVLDLPEDTPRYIVEAAMQRVLDEAESGK